VIIDCLSLVKAMKSLKTMRKIDELTNTVLEKEIMERKRREELMIRLIKSKNNNLKLFNLKLEGEKTC